MVSFNSNNYSVTWTKTGYNFDVEVVEIIIDYYVNGTKAGSIDMPGLVNPYTSATTITTATLTPYMIDIDFTQTIMLEIYAVVSGQFTNSMYPESWGPREVRDTSVYYTFPSGTPTGTFSNLGVTDYGTEYNIHFKFDFNSIFKNLSDVCLAEAGMDMGDCIMYCSVLDTTDLDQHKNAMLDYSGTGTYPNKTINGSMSLQVPEYVKAKTHYIMVGLEFRDMAYMKNHMVYSDLIEVEGPGEQIVQLSYGDNSWRDAICYVYDGTDFRPIRFNQIAK